MEMYKSYICLLRKMYILRRESFLPHAWTDCGRDCASQHFGLVFLENPKGMIPPTYTNLQQARKQAPIAPLTRPEKLSIMPSKPICQPSKAPHEAIAAAKSPLYPPPPLMLTPFREELMINGQMPKASNKSSFVKAVPAWSVKTQRAPR